MRIAAHNKLGQVIDQDITRAVIYDDKDNVIAIAITYAPGHTYVGHLKDKEFVSVLKMLGLDKNVPIVTDIKNPDNNAQHNSWPIAS